ncbi:similar to HEAT repeat protein [Plenodomus lingam JN3]|uniref:Similar to HEAT repeat protein n=1 Tax=Leptosphaeria maculans (strain JN3 / isolate v23.1.3 / race Av1-4-5-6-7-8) TaxID=985895 RepID=E5AF73_LEPMJ|nr:similar to HEAT repeat protein [Plenodomus lingam JN3]CBY01862.1 similar to HEAT repeat protein [Plenodomus lingam JN3]
MAAMSRGATTQSAPQSKKIQMKQLRAPRKVKGGTESTRNHVFKGFSQRIAQLKIEPVRRGRSTILDDAELESNFSYFRDSFLEWKELNMSEAFTSFTRKVGPLCDSLPQVLHHSDRIFALLVEFIERGETFSQEPLLSLMSHLAHDLGEKFEKHFEQAVRTVSRLASTHAEVEVIEWSFGCLAWLFKYLSRLLVPDLRPVFNLMSPLLGKEHQKAFVSRFAAESLSFLIRKAGVGYHRDKKPLQLIIRHISVQLQDLAESPRNHEFQHGIMYLLTDSLKGVQRGFHSSAAAILQVLLTETFDEDYIDLQDPPLERILIGVLTASIHHSDAETFKPLLDIVLAQINTISTDTRFVRLASHLLLVVSGVRVGARIIDWRPVLGSISRLVDSASAMAQLNPIDAWDLLAVVSVAFQYCAMDAAIPHEKILESLSKGVWEIFFLPFCNLFADLGAERFRALLLPYFKRFIAQKSHEHGPELCAVLPHLYHSGSLAHHAVQLPDRWQATFHEPFDTLTASDTQDNVLYPTYHCNALLETIGVAGTSQETEMSIQKSLRELLERAVTASKDQPLRTVDTFAVGSGFEFLVAKSDDKTIATHLWPLLCEASSVHGHSLAFWHAIRVLLQKHSESMSKMGPHMDTLKGSLMHCLGSPSHDLRLTAIFILDLIAGRNETLRNIISVAKLIEQTPLNLENQRAISMRTGQLAKLYPEVCSDEWIGTAIPTFCLGLLHVRMASVWDDTCTALKSMCETREGEEVITQTAFQWLSLPEDGESSAKNDVVPSSRRYIEEFECTNLVQVQEHVANIQTQTGCTEDLLRVMFEDKHAPTPFHNSSNRSQALRLFAFIPHIAEKRSRLLVPALLDWALDHPMLAADDGHNVADAFPTSSKHRWARKDQKAMLSVFAKFQNPKVLYRTDEVRQALLALLSNGDVDIQKAALKALLTWKDSAVIAHQEQLLNLLDDARFRDELPLFLSDGKLHDDEVAHILPIVLRLLYGKIISGKRGLESKRKAVFVGLKNRFGDEAIHQFLDIAFGPLSRISLIQNSSLDEELLQKSAVETRKQAGMLNLLDDLLGTLENTFAPFTSAVVDPVLYCAIKSSRSLTAVGTIEKNGDCTMQTSLLKAVRQRALHILAKLFTNSPDFDWGLYMQAIINELVEPRLEQLPIETAQSVSGILRLFAAWSKSPHTALFLVEYNKDVLIKAIDCLDVPSAKDVVRCFVLEEIIRNIVFLVTNQGATTTTESKLLQNRVQTEIIQQYSNVMLSRVGNLLRRSPSKDVLESGVQTVADMAPYVTGSVEARSMIEIATFLLRQPAKRVNSRTKLGLLKILHEFIKRCDQQNLHELFSTIYDAICPMFAFVHERTARNLLCDIVQDLAGTQEDLVSIAKLCYALNSFTKGRLDEPDFQCRSLAFDEINEHNYRLYSMKQWRPLAYNMLFFIKDNDELSIRVNASLSLRRLIEVSNSDEFKNFISTAVLPGIQSGVRETSELVRVEFLTVLEYLVKMHPNWSPLVDLHVLLSEDDEASFFSNILHMQGHRRTRALRRLATNASHLQGVNIYHILIPLLEHFVFNKGDDEGADSLLGETVRTLTALAEGLEWPQLRSLLKRYIGYLASKEDMQKSLIRLIAGLLDGLNLAGRAKGYVNIVDSQQDTESFSQGNDVSDVMDVMDVEKPLSTLTRTLPQQEKLTKDLIDQFLPDLTGFLHKKDEATVSLRVPIAVAIAKVLLVLPPTEIESRLPAVLLDICYILKSRAQESRDMARNTLSDIAVLMGPGYIGFILKALRTALQRGYQLHVLSFTLHHILVKLLDQLKPGDLDYCLADIVDVVMDDTFGITGQEKDAEEYISKMKEVKSSKSFDSMDIVARSATPSHIIKLVLPIKSLLIEKLNARMVQKIDELLRRIGLGVLQNPTVNNRDILVFCFELIKETYDASTSTDKKLKIDPKNKRYLINNRGAAKSGARLSTSSYLYKMIRFGIDTLRTVLRKHDELQTPHNLAGFLPVIGDAMVQGQEEVQVSAIRLLTTIIRVPMAELDMNCPVYIDEAMRAIKGALSSNTELAQASLKLVSAVLRERPNVEIKERDIGHLLKRMLPDFDEPDRSGVTFGFLKAVMNRQFDVPEMYEVMDKVAEMMITNQTKSARDLARSHYFQFLTSYTQSEKRFRKQMEFLLKNLRYEHVEGRQSVMDALDLVLTKALPRFPQKAQYEYHGMVFLPLISTVANDDSSKCRELASILIKRLFQYASDGRLQNFTADLKGWLEQDNNIGLRRLSIQCWGFYFEAMNQEDEPKELSQVLDQVDQIVDLCLTRRDEDDWELLYYALTLISKICKKYADIMFSAGRCSLWTAIEASASYPHMWVKLKSAELLGIYFAHLGISNKDTGLDALPLKGSGGLQLSEQSMTQLCNVFLRNLSNSDVTEQLCMQSVKNIAFLARCLTVNGAGWQWQKIDNDEDEEDKLTAMGTEVAHEDGMSSDEESARPKANRSKDTEALPTAIHRLMIRLSGIVRKDKSSFNAKIAIMNLFDTIAAKFPLEPLVSSLPHVVSTLNTLVDPATTIPREFTQDTSLNEPNETFKALIDKAREILSSIQKRLGTSEYLKIMSEVQKAVRERREERRRKRKVEAVADPEKWGKEKKRRNDVKRFKRKEKGQESRGRRRGW